MRLGTIQNCCFQQRLGNTTHSLTHQEDTHTVYKTGKHNTVRSIQKAQLRHHQIVWHNQHCDGDEECQQHTVENSFLVFEVVIHKGKGCQYTCRSLAGCDHNRNVKRIPDIGQQREVMQDSSVIVECRRERQRIQSGFENLIQILQRGRKHKHYRPQHQENRNKQKCMPIPFILQLSFHSTPSFPNIYSSRRGR